MKSYEEFKKTQRRLNKLPTFLEYENVILLSLDGYEYTIFKRSHEFTQFLQDCWPIGRISKYVNGKVTAVNNTYATRHDCVSFFSQPQLSNQVSSIVGNTITLATPLPNSVLTANATAGTFVVTVANAAPFSVGDYVKITEPNKVPTNAFIVNISGTQITVSPALADSYTSGNASIYLNLSQRFVYTNALSSASFTYVVDNTASTISVEDPSTIGVNNVLRWPSQQAVVKSVLPGATDVAALSVELASRGSTSIEILSQLYGSSLYVLPLELTLGAGRGIICRAWDIKNRDPDVSCTLVLEVYT